ncbi:thiamine-phosphate kinase [Nocardia shimofusensis]|uniref:thiamine-phosphate kinase n=1 Tax=Nocardia shimofusensis TaxID=228596 RepID=UPI00082EA518
MRELGEFALIERINAGRVPSAGVLLGPGDDAAVVAAPDGRFVVTTDMLVQDRHFRLDWSGPRDIGRKAIAQNAADVYAMGAVPSAFVVALGCPADTPVELIDELSDGMWAEARRAGASIAGGDLVRSPQLVISVTAFGDLRGQPAITRSGARPGDVVAVAGALGWSAAGLAVLEKGAEFDRADYSGHGLSTEHGISTDRAVTSGRPDAPADGIPARARVLEDVLAAHRAPQPRYDCVPVGAGPRPNALTDVSDGLLADLGHLATASGVAIDVHWDALRAPELEPLAAELNADAAQWVLAGGEDHAFAGAWPAEVGLPAGWRAIGVVGAGAGVTVDGVTPQGAGGWESFRGAEAAPGNEAR